VTESLTKTWQSILVEAKPFLAAAAVYLRQALATARQYLTRKQRRQRLFVWQLGSLEHRIFPKPEAVQELARLIEKFGNETEIHLLWGPELQVQVFDYDAGTDLHGVQILAPQNYGTTT
jgi:hypothetical protein